MGMSRPELHQNGGDINLKVRDAGFLVRGGLCIVNW